MPDTIEQQHIPSTDQALEAFAMNPNLVIATPGRSCLKNWITIPSGFYALVTNMGAEIPYEKPDGSKSPVWPAGFHVAMPWVQVSHLVTKSSFVFDIPCKALKSLDNVTIEMDIACVLRIMGDEDKGENPDLVGKFVHEVTTRGLQQQLTDAIDEACRVLARSMKHRECYGLRNIRVSEELLETGLDSKVKFEDTDERTEAGLQMGNIYQENDETELFIGGADKSAHAMATAAGNKGQGAAARMISTLNRQFKPQGVEITDIIITDIKLPHEIVSQMTSKTMVISSNAQEIMTQQFEMQDLNYSEANKLMQQTYKEERMREEQQGEQERQEVSIRLQDMKAEESKKLRLIQEENRVLLQSISANCELEVTKLTQERNAIVTELAAKSSQEAARLRAEAERYRVEKLSLAQLEVQRNEAAAMEVISNAEGVIAPLLRQFNDHETSLRGLEVFSKFANNKDVVIAPSGNDDIQTMLLCDQILASSAGSRNQPTRSEILSELMLMKAGGQVALNTGTGSAILATR
jgi:regulator of protease activity HflC (stomatin/prohibitin superfamily)